MAVMDDPMEHGVCHLARFAKVFLKRRNEHTSNIGHVHKQIHHVESARRQVSHGFGFMVLASIGVDQKKTLLGDLGSVLVRYRWMTMNAGTSCFDHCNFVI